MPSAATRAVPLCLLGFVFLFSPLRSRAQETLRLDGIGLNDYYAPNVPTPVDVHIPPVSASSVRIEILMESGFNNPRIGITRASHFSQTFPMTPGKPRDAEIPVMLTPSEKMLLTLTAYLPDGSSRGTISRPISFESVVGPQNRAVVVLCREDAACGKIQSDVTFSGTKEDRAARIKSVHWVFLASPRENWWSYSAARVIFIAAPISGFSDPQRLALEEFVRGGGYLVLLEKEAADPGFLAEYRRAAYSNGESAITETVGEGRLIRIPSESDLQNAMEKNEALRAGLSAPNGVGTGAAFDGAPSFADVLANVGIVFHFPRLRWVLIALGAYILVVGPLNFLILRKMQHLDWGWVTVSALAVIFAMGFYVAGSWHRPRTRALDQVAGYVLDSRSPLAIETLDFRASVPSEGRVSLSIADPLFPAFWPSPGSDSPDLTDSILNIGASATDRPLQTRGWDLRFGPPQTIAFDLLRWSYRDYHMLGFRQFPGTVHWISPGRLKNDTGQTFREAFYFDYSENTRYYLSRFAPGDEADLSQLKQDPIWDPAKLQEGTLVPFLRGDSRQTFDPASFPYLMVFRRYGQRFFEGVEENPPNVVEWITPGSNRNTVSLTIVKMLEP